MSGDPHVRFQRSAKDKECLCTVTSYEFTSISDLGALQFASFNSQATSLIRPAKSRINPVSKLSR